MVLEAVMVVVDNSESSRNGDYTPTRYEAQSDAVSLIFSAITQANPESSVGLMSMGGKGPEVLVTLTTDHGKILEGLHRTKSKIRGGSHLATGIQIAGLALKHRQNKSQRQRIIVFTCSPIPDDEKSLTKLAKKMKKNTVSIDFVAFGELDDDTTKKLTSFNENVKGGEGSHIAIIPPGPGLLSDQLVTSPILNGDGASGGGGGEGAGAAENFEFGVDPSMDPELALALRMSMEEEKARQDKQNKEVAEQEAKDKAKLEGIKEEDEAGEKAPLLGEGSGKNDKKDDEDKMDTA
ncbi:26S proteasome regulatory subunit S5A, multiubiquitin chain binding protein [Leptodontidium sp. 2 PMI_412]|nr:26S proteasome regulatory subunit S5A, multiubiquitin chain binding protein [Leptodontidium sp. MPI-SDFR-AT-0119]KAH9212063.1 26S proteasome regulatory subunit S5A, multiubiquitin chain binding protein [Leptodontidium sp. 2 PMI_412]